MNYIYFANPSASQIKETLELAPNVKLECYQNAKDWDQLSYQKRRQQDSEVLEKVQKSGRIAEWKNESRGYPRRCAECCSLQSAFTFVNITALITPPSLREEAETLQSQVSRAQTRQLPGSPEELCTVTRSWGFSRPRKHWRWELRTWNGQKSILVILMIHRLQEHWYSLDVRPLQISRWNVTLSVESGA